MNPLRLKILKIFIIFFTVQLSILLAQKSDIIIQDNWDQTTDKLAHSTTSFGLYYTLRYFEFTKFEAFTAATLIGFSYEIYQINDPRETDSDFRGISIQDMGYNILGIFSAYVFDKAITLTKSNLRAALEKSKELAKASDNLGRMRNILKLARSASSAKGPIARGTPEGKAMQFQIFSTFCFGAIIPIPGSNADASRIVELELNPHDNDRSVKTKIDEGRQYFQLRKFSWPHQMIGLIEPMLASIQTFNRAMPSGDIRHHLNMAILLGALFLPFFEVKILQQAIAHYDLL